MSHTPPVSGGPLLASVGLLVGGGATGARIRSRDWSATPIGAPAAWPRPLRTAFGIALASGFPTALAWGPKLLCFHNDAFLRFLGAGSDALGRPFEEVWPEAWDTVGPVIARTLAGEAGFLEDLPLTLLERDGRPEETWWTFFFSPVLDETGGVGGVLAAARETTDRVSAERRLRFLVEVGARLRGMAQPGEVTAATVSMLGRHLGADRAGYGEVDPTGTFVTVESEWAGGAGAAGRAAAPAGRLWRLDRLGAPLARELLAGRAVRVDDARADPRASGEDAARLGLRSAILVPLLGPGGRVSALFHAARAEPRRWRDSELAVAQEVAQTTWEAACRLRAEAALRASEERFRQFAEHSTDVLWILDAEAMRAEYLSPAFERVWGLPPSAFDDASARRWLETIHPEDRARAVAAMDRARQGGAVVEEYRVTRPDGAVRRVRDTFFPIRDAAGRVTRVAGIAKDVTQHEGSLVYVVDGPPAAREWLRRVLQGAGYQARTFGTVSGFLEAAPALLPGCVVLDISAPEAGGLAVPRELKARRVALPVIVTGPGGDVELAVRAMKAGAADFLDAPCSECHLLAAVASAMADIRDTEGRDRAAELAAARVAGMSAREREVLDLLLAGGTNKTMARDLGISPRTVEVHRARVMERLGARTLPQAVLAAAAAGLKPPPPDDGSNQAA